MDLSIPNQGKDIAPTVSYVKRFLPKLEKRVYLLSIPNKWVFFTGDQLTLKNDILKTNFLLVHTVKPQVAQDDLLKWDMLLSDGPNGPGGPYKMENVPNRVTCLFHQNI